MNAHALSQSLLRQAYYINLLQQEQSFFLKQKMPSGVKNVLHRLSQSNASGIEQLLTYLPNSREQIKEVLNDSEEKMAVIGDIIALLAKLDEPSLHEVEKAISENIKVQ